MSKTILVTGGTGFIGNCFCKLLLAERPEYRVLNVDVCTYAANPSTIEEELKNPNYKFYKTDIRDREAIEKIFEEEKPDIVVNFAAESHVDRSITNPQIFLETNILGTAVLMDACRKYGIERYHQVSTDEVYGDLPLDRPDLFFHEDTPLHTSSPYSTSKASADLSLMLENKPINVFEDGSESRDFINVVDIASGVIASLENEKSNGETINLGSGVGTSVNEITEILKKAYNSNSEIRITGDFRLGDIAHNVADISKAENILDFKVTVGLEEGLTQFCNWVKGQEHDNSGYEKSLNEMEEAGMFIRK